MLSFFKKNLRVFSKIVTTISILLISIPSYAFHVQSLYRTQVPVQSQNAANRQPALTDALAQMFVKISGNSKVVDNPIINKALMKPEHYVLSYSYEDITLPDNQEKLVLDASFDPKAIRAALTAANANIWGSNRPVVLVWLNVENSGGATILSQQMQTLLKAQLKEDAHHRGIPLIFPLMDNTDVQNINTNELTKDNIQAIKNASERYQSDAILVVNVKHKREQYWQASWTLIDNANTVHWGAKALSSANLFKKGVDVAADALAVDYGTASSAGKAEKVQLTVINVDDVSDYASLSQYLQQLLPVKQLELQAVNANSVVYDLTVLGGELGLQKALTLDHKLSPLTVIPDMQDLNTGLVYEWKT